jgi:hypothetical protein
MRQQFIYIAIRRLEAVISTEVLRSLELNVTGSDEFDLVWMICLVPHERNGVPALRMLSATN